MKVSVLRQAAANSGSWKTRVKLEVPTHSGSAPGVYFWKAITTARMAGYQEKRAKQSSPPRRKAYALDWSARRRRNGRPPGPGRGAATGRTAVGGGAAGLDAVFMVGQPRARIASIFPEASLSSLSMSASFLVRTAETALSRTE